MAISRIRAALGPEGTPTFASLRLPDLADSVVRADSDGVLQPTTIGSSLSFSAPTLDTIQDIRTTASPAWTGLAINSGIFKVSETKAGFLFGTSDFPAIFSANTVGVVRSNGGAAFTLISTGSGTDNAFITYAAGGTIGSPTATANAQTLFRFSGRGHDGNGWIPLSRALLEFNATQTWESGKNGTYCRIRVTPTDSQTLTTAINFYGDQVTVPLSLVCSGGLTVVNAVTEFSTDGTFTDDSDAALPTEKAVKTYVDAAVGNTIEHIADEAARLALSPTAENGDIVYQEDTGNLYFYRELT